MSSCSDATAAMARQQDWQILIVVAITVTDRAAVANHRVIKQVPIDPVGCALEPLQQIGKLCDVEPIDLSNLGMLRGIAAVV